MDSSTIIEGNVKFRDGKKWKARWCVMRKLSPVADCLHLQLYRDSRDRYKQGLTKASLSLQHFLGLETGFTLDKESNTVAIICQDIIVVLAFDTRERLIQWQVKFYTHLGEDEQYLIQISSSPPKTKFSVGPAKLHVQDHRFCLTIGVPPKLFGNWQIKHLRRFGVVDGKFCFEGGSLCGRGEGLYVFLTDQAEEIAHHVQLAAEGKLKTCKRTSLKNSTVARCESPRKSVTLSRNETQRTTAAQIIGDYVYDGDTGLNHNRSRSHVHNGSGSESGTIEDDDVRRWPSVETQAALYGHADTSSLADFAIDSQNGKVCNWRLENQLMGRCVSCAGKLGLISRCSTAANTPGSINFNPWSNDDSKLYSDDVREQDFADESDCRCNASSVLFGSRKGKYSASERSSSSGRTECSEDHSCCLHSHSSAENLSKKKTNDTTLIPSSPPSSGIASSNAAYSPNPNAPSRPPKPQKYSNLSDNLSRPSLTANKTDKAPLPLPLPLPLPCKVDGACGESRTCCRRNYDSPSSNKNQTILNLNAKNMCSNASQFYDTPRNMKGAMPIACESFSNYDVPPSAVHRLYDCHHCSCAAKTRLSLRADNVNCNEESFCRKVANYSPVWLQVPLHHIQSRNHWPNNGTTTTTEIMEATSTSDVPVYAQVDLSKKLKNRLAKETAVGVASELHSVNSNSCYTNVRFDDETVSYDRLANLNYMNLEFTHSLRFYENVGELIESRNDSSRIDSLNIDLPGRSSISGACCAAHLCRKCGHADDPGQNIRPMAGGWLEMRRLELENYVPMSPLRCVPKRGGGQHTTPTPETLSSHDRPSAATATNVKPTSTTTPPPASTTMCPVTASTTTGTVNGTPTNAAAAAAIAFAASTTGDEKDSSTRTKLGYSILKEIDMSDEAKCRPILDARVRSNSIECDTAAARAKASLGDSDSGLESDKLSQENDDIVDNLKRRKVNQFLSLRRFAGNGCKVVNANRDSSSSNDSGFSSASFKFAGGEFSDFEMPLTTVTCAKRHHSFNQRCQKNDCVLPRRSKSSDPLRGLTWHFHQQQQPQPQPQQQQQQQQQQVVSPVKSSSAEAKLPLCLNSRDPDCCKDCLSPADTTVSTPYVYCRSTSSGTSDMSDYIETLSLSSHSSADVHSTEAVKLHHSAMTTLKPRSGVEYQKIDRSSLLNVQSKINT